MVGRRWTEKEEEFIKRNYQTMSDKEIAEELEGRTKAAVMNRRQVLDLSKDGWSKKNWSDKELKILKENSDKPIDKISDILPNRNKKVIRSKKSKMGWVTDRKWSEEETEFLERVYQIWSAKEIAEYLNKDPMSVYNKVKAEDLSYLDLEDWSEEEVEYLKENYRDSSYEEIADHLDRSVQSVRDKASKIGCVYQVRWTSEEEEFLQENFPELSDRELADELDRTVRSVKNRRRRKFGLIRPGMLEDTIWRSWEQLCIMIAQELYSGVETKPELSNGTYPDLRIGDLVVDAKKTPHTHRVAEDVKNYRGHCGRLEFWCFSVIVSLSSVMLMRSRFLS